MVVQRRFRRHQLGAPARTTRQYAGVVTWWPDVTLTPLQRDRAKHAPWQCIDLHRRCSLGSGEARADKPWASGPFTAMCMQQWDAIAHAAGDSEASLQVTRREIPLAGNQSASGTSSRKGRKPFGQSRWIGSELSDSIRLDPVRVVELRGRRCVYASPSSTLWGHGRSLAWAGRAVMPSAASRAAVASSRSIRAWVRSVASCSIMIA